MIKEFKIPEDENEKYVKCYFDVNREECPIIGFVPNLINIPQSRYSIKVLCWDRYNECNVTPYIYWRVFNFNLGSPFALLLKEHYPEIFIV